MFLYNDYFRMWKYIKFELENTLPFRGIMVNIDLQNEESMSKKVLVIAVLMLSFSSLFAQNVYEFLKIDPSPRAAALAGSYVANHDDVNALFYNPAAIKQLEGTPVSFSYINHLLDINMASVAASYDFEGIGRFAAGIEYINYGDFDRADEYGNLSGTFGVGDFAMVLGYGNELDKNFYYGANVKFIFSKIDDRSSAGLAVDLGLQYVFPEQLFTIGLSARNLGGQMSAYYNTKEDLPLDVSLGVSKRLQHMPFEFYFSFNKLNEKEDNFTDRLNKFTFGGELRLSKTIHIRLGYDNERRDELKIGTTAGLAGFHIGVGINVKEYRIDYAMSSLGAIGELHRIGISTSL